MRISYAFALLFACFLFIAAGSVAASALIPLQVSQARIDVIDLIPGYTFQETFIVTNTGASSQTNLKARADNLGRFNLTFSPAGYFNLNAGQQQVITVTGKASKSLDARKSMNPYTGTLYVNNTNSNGQVSMYISGKRMAVIEEFSWTDGTEDIYDNGSTVYDVYAGTNTSVSGRIRNLFDEDVRMDDVKVTLTIKGFDIDGNDYVDIARISDIGNRDYQRFDFNVNVPYNADEKTYKVIIKVEAKDHRKAKYDEQWELGLDVRRYLRKISIARVQLSRSTVDCDRSFSLNTMIENTGDESTEDAVVLSIQSSSLGIDVKENVPTLYNDPTYSGSTFSKTYDFKVGPDVSPGNYPIDITTFVDTTLPIGFKRVNFHVMACGSATTTTTAAAATTTSKVSTTTTTANGVTTTSAAKTTTTTSFGTGQKPGSETWQKPGETKWLSDQGISTNSIYIILLIGAGLVLLFLVIYLVILLK